MSRKAVYMPKIGRFVFSWKAIQWNRKIDKIKKEEYDDQNKGCQTCDDGSVCDE